MNQNFYRYLVSSITTFLATFITVAGAQLASGLPPELSGAFFASLVVSAARAALKAALEGAGMTGSSGIAGSQAR